MRELGLDGGTEGAQAEMHWKGRINCCWQEIIFFYLDQEAI